MTLRRPGQGLCLGLAILLMVGCRDSQDRSNGPSRDLRPNIILITVESLRADHVGCYGYERDTTPALDALSKEAITFDKAHAVTSWTLTTHASIFTGLYPTAHRVVRPFDKLDGSYRTLAEVLKEGGYQTAGFVSGPFLRTNHNLNQGFELYDESTVEATGIAAVHGSVTNPRMELLVTSFLKNRRDEKRPFFLFVYLWDPHFDYIPPSPYNQMFVPSTAEPIELSEYESSGVVNKDISPGQLAYVISQYDGEIRWTDELLGRLWELLRDLGLWERTAIIVTSDHGEEFFEHGTKGHKNNLYVESLHVPLVIKTSGATVSRRDGRIVNLIDLFPTVLEMANQETPRPFHGRSLLQPAPREAVPTFFELVTSLYIVDDARRTMQKQSETWLAVLEDNYKLVTRLPGDTGELYGLAKDPGELHPLGPEHQTKLEALRRKLEAHQAAMKRVATNWGKAEPADLSAADLESLRSLGYIGPKPDSQRP